MIYLERGIVKGLSAQSLHPCGETRLKFRHHCSTKSACEDGGDYGSVAKKHRGKQGMCASVICSALGDYSKEGGDQRHLAYDISFPSTIYLSLSEHVHDLIAL